ncbi:hypothetical protein PAMA110636_19165 [Paenibacillus macerans]
MTPFTGEIARLVLWDLITEDWLTLRTLRSLPLS